MTALDQAIAYAQGVDQATHARDAATVAEWARDAVAAKVEWNTAAAAINAAVAS